jgi:S-ribosylhomocysteine lyase LuxS involved in autoinducer biosynthesis
MPPSQAMIVDCQPLSCQAIALMSFVGRLTDDAVQNRLAAAASSAVRTVDFDASVPS